MGISGVSPSRSLIAPRPRGLPGRVVTLKLKRANHSTLTRRHSLHSPTQIADLIYRTARGLLDQTISQGPFRLLGCGISDLVPESQADLTADLLDPDAGKRATAERAADEIRKRFGKDAILKGRALR